MHGMCVQIDEDVNRAPVKAAGSVNRNLTQTKQVTNSCTTEWLIKTTRQK